MGDGNSINITGQPWLLDNQNPFINLSSQSLVNGNVSVIMATEHKGWDEDILADLFNEKDRNCS